MCARLDSYLKSNNILCTNQFGFRKNSNTSDAIIEFLDYVYSSLDSKQSTIAVYVDFQKRSTQLIITYWWVSSCIMAWEVSCSTGLSLIWVTWNNTSQSKTAVLLSQTLHWVFHKARCWSQYFFWYINYMYRSSNQMRIVRLADDTTVCASDSDINNVHATVNRELVRPTDFLLTSVKLHIW